MYAAIMAAATLVPSAVRLREALDAAATPGNPMYLDGVHLLSSGIADVLPVVADIANDCVQIGKLG